MNTIQTDDGWSFDTDGNTMWVIDVHNGSIVKIIRTNKTLAVSIWDSEEEMCLASVEAEPPIQGEQQ